MSGHWHAMTMPGRLSIAGLCEGINILFDMEVPSRV